MKKLQTSFANLLIGIPGGCLIFMGMLMFNAILGLLVPVGAWTMLVILCLTALVVGMMARLVRPINGFGAAAASGVVAAAIILILRQASAPGSNSPLVFGPAGILAAIVFSMLGGWLIPRLRKHPK